MRRLFGCPDIVSLTEKFVMARNFFRIFTENNPVMGDSKTLCIPEAKGLTTLQTALKKRLNEPVKTTTDIFPPVERTRRSWPTSPGWTHDPSPGQSSAGWCRTLGGASGDCREDSPKGNSLQPLENDTNKSIKYSCVYVTCSTDIRRNWAELGTEKHPKS